MEKKLTAIFILISTWCFGQTDFSKIAASTDSTYGYTDQNPLKLKRGNPGKSIGYSYDFLQGLRTHDDQKLKFIQRITVDNPNDRKRKNPDNEAPLNDHQNQLDKYIFLTSEKKDTVTIYVDVHHKGDLRIPMGLKFQTRAY